MKMISQKLFLRYNNNFLVLFNFLVKLTKGGRIDLPSILMHDSYEYEQTLSPVLSSLEEFIANSFADPYNLHNT